MSNKESIRDDARVHVSTRFGFLLSAVHATVKTDYLVVLSIMGSFQDGHNPDGVIEAGTLPMFLCAYQVFKI